MKMKKIKGWRTIVFNVAALLPVLPDIAIQAAQLIVAVPEIRGILPDGWLPYYAVGVSLANIYLRSITSTPVGRGG